MKGNKEIHRKHAEQSDWLKSRGSCTVAGVRDLCHTSTHTDTPIQADTGEEILGKIVERKEKKYCVVPS